MASEVKLLAARTTSTSPTCRPDDTVDHIAYDHIAYRLKSGGCEREVFTSDAVAMIHEAARGSLRDIDRVATAAPRESARRRRKLVERDVVTRVIGVLGV